ILLGVGDGTFQDFGDPIPVGDGPISIVAEDFDGDHNLDLAVGNGGSGSVSLLLGDGEGGFTDAGDDFASGGDQVSLVKGDFNEDGLPDLATADRDKDRIRVLLSGPDGPFSQDVVLSTADFPRHITTGDFNHDGHLDLAAGHVEDYVTIRFGRG